MLDTGRLLRNNDYHNKWNKAEENKNILMF